GCPSHTAQQCRAAFYHNLCPDLVDQSITEELMRHRDKHSADNYGVQLIEVYVDHAYSAETERPAFEQMLEEARNGRFDCIITKSIERFAPTSEETIQVIEELLSLPNPVTVIFESDMLDSNVIHSVIPILRGCCI
ncbi:MAG: recombinase family protein, partial [Clostridiales bacterium]|nr:recombinase family protein [Clostridiales bacterium]